MVNEKSKGGVVLGSEKPIFSPMTPIWVKGLPGATSTTTVMVSLVPPQRRLPERQYAKGLCEALEGPLPEPQ